MNLEHIIGGAVKTSCDEPGCSSLNGTKDLGGLVRPACVSAMG